MATKKTPTPATPPTARKAPARKTAAGATTALPAAPAKKAAAKKAAVKQVATQSVGARKVVARKSAPKTAPAPSAAVKETAAPKVAARKAATKAPAGTTAAAPPAARKAPATVAVKAAAKAPARKAARKAAAPRARAVEFDPAAQLDKLEASPPTRSRGMSRGLGAPAAVAGLPADFFAGYTGEALGDAAFAQAAQVLGCEVAAVRAVAEVESRGSGFDSQRRPTILYERHVFSRCTTPKGRFDGAHPDVSFGKPYAPGTYGNTEQQWLKLGKAHGLDAVAALKAPSWGIFQILGENHKACGFASVVDFARAMTTSPVAHLAAFVAFVRANPTMHKAIRERNWAAFARAYNGPNFATFKYDTKMAAAYAKHAGLG